MGGSKTWAGWEMRWWIGQLGTLRESCVWSVIVLSSTLPGEMGPVESSFPAAEEYYYPGFLGSVLI